MHTKHCTPCQNKGYKIQPGADRARTKIVKCTACNQLKGIEDLDRVYRFDLKVQRLAS